MFFSCKVKICSQKIKEQKKTQLNQNVGYLVANSIPFKKFTEYHYRIADLFDFWPSTGKFKNVNTKELGHGVEKLHKLLRKICVGSGHVSKSAKEVYKAHNKDKTCYCFGCQEVRKGDKDEA